MNVMRLDEQPAPDGGAPGLHVEILDDVSGQTRTLLCFPLDKSKLLLRPVFAPFDVTRSFVECLLVQRPQWIVIGSLSAVTMDLARIAAALEFKVAVRLPEAGRVDETDQVGLRWLFGLLSSVTRLLPPSRAEDEDWLRARLPEALAQTAAADAGLNSIPENAPSVRQFGYEAYAFGRRDHGLLYTMQEPFVDHFRQCERVLDVGCGTGVFLEALARHGVSAQGVERNLMSACFARSLGHAVATEDALVYLEAQSGQWDGVYCSHFIEHLPIDVAERLVARVAAALKPGGVAVFVFPDPESIRSQLLGFWRDPEHVRFYHPELVVALAQIYGLEVEYDSQQCAGRAVVPFAMQPPLLAPEPVHKSGGLWAACLRGLGIAPSGDLQTVQRRAERMEAAVRQLWAVNQTWAWDDNAVLRFRKCSAGT